MNLLITGSNGFLGRHVTKLFKENGRIFTPSSEELDLRYREDVINYFQQAEITHVIHLAASVAGIGGNMRFPVKQFYDNLNISLNVMYAAHQSPYFQRMVNACSICSYPKYTPVPFKEEDLWNGYPEETNAPFGIAKKAAMSYAEHLNKQYRLIIANLLLVNMAGEHDNFHPIYSHVIPAIILKIDRAIDEKRSEVELWGTGTATREFLYAGDAAVAIKLSLERSEDASPINIGTGKEISIRDLADMIAEKMNYGGDIVFGGQVSDGQPRRCLDVTKAKEKLGFVAETSLDEILNRAINYFWQFKKDDPERIIGYRGIIDQK